MDYANGVLSYVMGPGLIPQLLLTVVILLVLYSIITIFETVVESVKKVDRQSTVLLEDTHTSTKTIVQNQDSDALIYNSENELNGMEFSYSMYLLISPETFQTSVSSTCGGTIQQNKDVLKHVFHKGSKDKFPLLAPGLFVLGDKNTLRLYMNSSTQWDNYVDIPNIPIGKWFHIVIIMKGKYLDVYINGNVTIRHEFATVPKLNYGNIYIFNPRPFPTDPGVNIVAAKGFRVDNAATGMISRMKYYAYALNYAQIDALYREGPSKTIVSQTFQQKPPYFYDDWWVTRY